MKRTRIFTLVLVVFLLTTMIAGCGTTPSGQSSTPAPDTSEKSSPSSEPVSSEPVKITLMNTKGEIAATIEEAAKQFSSEKKNITLEIVPVPAGKSPFEALSAMYNSGNAPTLSMIDSGDIPRLKDNFLSLNNEKWMADAIEGTTKVATIDGTTYAFPFTIEGYGLIYNKPVLDKAYGGNFDPSTITTKAALKEAFDKVEASGVKAITVSPMDWSLGAHMFSINYIVEGKGKQASYDKLFADLKSGNIDISKNESFNNWVDTFDLLKEYNAEKADPLAATYEKGPEALGKGEVGFWFMGNWAWPQVKEFDTTGEQYGFIPFPMGDNASGYGNNSIVSFPSKFVAIDKTQNSEEQQAAAKEFLNWIVYESSGQDALVNKMNLIPAFSNITLPIADPLGNSIAQYMSEGKSLSAIDTYTVMPADHWSQVGASLQKYLSDYSDRATLAKEIQDYWKTVK